MQNTNYNVYKVFDYQNYNNNLNIFNEEKDDINEQIKKIDPLLSKIEGLIKKQEVVTTGIFQDVQSFFNPFSSSQNSFANRSIINQQQIDLLTESAEQVNTLYTEILKLNEKLSQPLNPTETRETLTELYKAEEKFSLAYLNFISCKSGLLSHLITFLNNPAENFVNKENQIALREELEKEHAEKIDKLQAIGKQLQEIKGHLAKLESTEWVVKAQLEKLHGEISKEDKELLHAKQMLSNNMYDQYIMPQYDLEHKGEHSLIRENQNYQQSLQSFYQKVPLNEEEKTHLEKLQRELATLSTDYSDQLKNFSVSLSDQIKALSSVEGKDKNEIERFCKKSVLNLSMLHQHFERKCVETIHYKQQILQKAFHSESIIEEDFKKHTEEIRQELAETIKRFKTVRDEIAFKKEIYAKDFEKTERVVVNEFILVDPLEDIRESETWALTSWGELLLPQSTQESIIDSLATGFQNTVDDLKKEIRHLKQLDQTSKDPIKQEKIRKDVNELNLILHHTLLQRIIDVVGKKQKLLKTDLTPQQKTQLKIEIELLNVKYNKLLVKYDNIPKSQKSLLEASFQQFTNLTKSLLTFGYFNGRLLTSEELKYKKHYADLGYDTMENLKTWLNDLQIKENESFLTVLNREVQGFLVWADKHPHAAMNLVGDIALTCAVIGGKDYMDQFLNTMRSKAYTAAFLEGWSIFPYEDPLETREELKYRALADLFRCAPVMTAMIRPMLVNEFVSLQKTLFTTGLEVIKAFTAQQAQYFIPAEYTRVALGILQVVKGENFQRVLEEQRNIELARLGGVGVKALINPKGILNDIKLRLKLWTKTLTHCKGWEKVARIATQIFVPTFGVLSAIGLTTLVIMGGPITWIIAGLALLTVSISVAKKTDQLFNRIFPAYQEVLKEIEENKKQETRKEIKKEIQAEREKFIEELKARGSLPQPSKISPPKLTDEQQEIYQKQMNIIVLDFQTKLNQEWGKKIDKTAVDCVQIFTKEVIDRIKTAVQTSFKEIDDANQNPNSPLYLLSQALTEEKDKRLLQVGMAEEIVNHLIKDWLNPHIDLIFTEYALKERSSPPSPSRDPNQIIQEEVNKILPNTNWGDFAGILQYINYKEPTN